MGYQHEHEKLPVQDVHTPGIGLPGNNYSACHSLVNRL